MGMNRAYILQSSVKTASNGKRYISLELILHKDSPFSRRRKTTFWDPGEGDREKLSPGTWIRLVECRENKGFLELKAYEVIQEPENLEEFVVETSEIDADELCQNLNELIQTINDKGLRTLVSKVLEEHWDTFVTAPAAVSHHHNYPSGLLDHTVQTASLCLAISEVLKERGILLNNDVLLAGALLHDIGKVMEYETDDGLGQPKYIQSAVLTGTHSLFEMRIVESAFERLASEGAEGDPQDLPSEKHLNIVVHLIGSHHGTKDWGAIITPAIPEAFALHFADMISSKVTQACQVLEQTAPGTFTSRFFSWYGEKIPVYKPFNF